jgi:hypothetical protein
MPSKIDVFGWQGVNTTKSAIQLDDNELSKAQNAFRDSAGEHGALRKRPGLTKINSTALSGSILGFINVPLNAVTVRTFYIGADQTATAPAYTWFTSVNAFGAIVTAATPGAIPQRALSAGTFFGTIGSTLLNTATQSERVLVYPGDHTNGDVWPIRMWDGTIDRQLFQIPYNALGVATVPTVYGPTAYAAGAAAYASQICQMLFVGAKLYIVIADYVVPAIAAFSRVLEYDVDTRTLRQIGQGAGSLAGDMGDGAVLFRSLTSFQGYLYAGVGSITTGYNSTDAGIWKIKPDTETVWVRELSLESGAVGETPICLAEYGGKLYAGLQDYDTASQRLLSRAATGSWSSSNTVGTAVGSGWLALQVFESNLYATSYDAAATPVTRVHKFDGTTWSIVKTIATASNARMGVAMVVHNDQLYVLAINASGLGLVTYTADGTSWTDLSTGLTDDVSSIFGVLGT